MIVFLLLFDFHRLLLWNIKRTDDDFRNEHAYRNRRKAFIESGALIRIVLVTKRLLDRINDITVENEPIESEKLLCKTNNIPGCSLFGTFSALISRSFSFFVPKTPSVSRAICNVTVIYETKTRTITKAHFQANPRTKRTARPTPGQDKGLDLHLVGQKHFVIKTTAVIGFGVETESSAT